MPYLFLLLGVFVLILAGVYDNFAGEAHSLYRYANQIENKLHSLEQEVNTFFGDPKQIEAAANGELSSKILENLNKKLYTICIYEMIHFVFGQTIKYYLF